MNVLFAARAEVRKNFESNRHLSAGSEEYKKSITHAEEVAKFLRENVVQGKATEVDKYRMNELLKIHVVSYSSYSQSYGYTSTPSEGTMKISSKHRERRH